MSLEPLAIVAGAGDLPRMIAENCKFTRRPYQVVCFGGVELDWVKDHPKVDAEFEKPAALFSKLKAASCSQVTFAGAMQRPNLRVTKFDWKFLKLAPTLLPALKGGDDQTLRVISAIFEAEGLELIAPNSLLDDVNLPVGTPTKLKPSDADFADIERAREVLRALGAVDVAQSTVVAQGICLGIETIQGTDALLRFVSETSEGFKPDPKGAKGVLVKLPKLAQDLRVDMPTIGPATIENAANSGVSGVAVQEGGVMILGRDETVALADKLGIFLTILGSK